MLDLLKVVIAIVGMVAVLAVADFVAGRLLRRRFELTGVVADPTLPVDGPVARDLAVGLLTITDHVGYWNDPDARLIASRPALVRALRRQWRIHHPADWRAHIERLVTHRRRSEPRDTLLQIRWAEAQRAKRRPQYRDWLSAVEAGGGSTQGQNAYLIGVISSIEQRLEVYDGGNVLPARVTVRDVYAFAYSQAVALAVWGVAMGVATRDEAIEVARVVSERARSEYGSWQEFGRSVLLGRAMFLGQNGYTDDSFDPMMRDAIRSYVAATNAASESPGPWTYLPW